MDNQNVFCNIFGKSKKSTEKETPFCTRRASFTIEAAVIFPLFAGFLVSILFFFQVMRIQQSVETSLQYTAREMAVYSYEKRIDKTAINVAAAQIMFASELSKTSCPVQYVSGKKIHLDYLTSSVAGDYIDLQVHYEVKLPISLFGKVKLPMVQMVKARKWTGFHGEQETDALDGFVYVTPHGTVYHTSLDCAYLDLSIRGVGKDELEGLRNKEGSIYKKCGSCGTCDTGRVYITDYGNCYHTSLSCSGLKRTVYLIRRTEAVGYGACKKCATE